MTKNLTKNFLVTFAVIAAILANAAFAGEVKSTESKSSTVNTNEDPDLKLSIEELKKKYPIDWLEKKYGKVTPENCLMVDDEPESGEAIFREVESWPCGSACERHSKYKNCPKACSDIQPKNLVCTFFKEIYEENPQGKSSMVYKPVAKFEDFSTEEIKSAFIYFDTDSICGEAEGNCGRIKEIIAITFIHFLENESLKKEDLPLKRFLLSNKISKKLFVSKNYKISALNRCNLFSRVFLESSIPPVKLQNFCLLTVNE